MKIGLISPFRSQVNTYYTNNPELQSFFNSNKNVPVFFHPNLALLTVASLTPETIEIRLVDERINTLTFKEDFDLVGISMITAQATRGYEIAEQFKKQGAYTVLGGIHPTICPEEASLYCDTVIAGEAENTWPQFLEDYQQGHPKKLYHESGVDISKSPIPRYDLIDTSTFHLFPIQTTRGCPHDCSFCSVKTVFGPRYRIKTTTQIMNELKAIQNVAKNRRCVFNDDNMFVDKKRTYEILEAIKPLKIKYFAQTDISIADDEQLLKMLRASGCVTVFIGFESLVPENLAGIQKSGWKLKQSMTYSEKCRKIQSNGIQVLGSFLVGLDYDTRESLLRLRDFILKNHIWAQLLFITPFPGTRIREELIKQGRLSAFDSDWDLYTCFDAVFEPLKMKVKELNNTVLEIYQSIYSDAAHKQRLRYMVDHIKTAFIE